MKKFISAVLGTMMLFSSASVFAMDAKQEGAKTVVLTGNVGEADALVAVDVYANGKTKDDLISMKENGENILNALVARLQTAADENGDFEVSFDIALSTGKYTAFAGSLNTELEPYTFIFVSETEYSDFAENFSDVSASDVKAIISDSNKCYILGISETEAKALNSTGLSEVILNTISESKVDVADRDAVWALVDKAYFVQQLNEGLIEDVLEADGAVSGIAESDVAEWVTKEFVTDSIVEEFNARLINADFESYNDYENSVPESFVLSVIKCTDGVAEIEEVVTAFEDEIGINVTSSTPERVWNKLLRNDYDSFEELAEAFSDFEEEGNKVGSSSSGGGGGSKGSGTKNTAGVAGSIVTQPSLNNNIEDAKLSPEIFDDLENVLWAKEAIVALAEKNIVSGVGNNKFNPDGLITREQFAKIVVGAFVPGAEGEATGFTDVIPGSWYAEFIEKAYAENIVSGMGNGKFGVGLSITRQDMCVMIYNAAKAAGIELDGNADEAFADDANISDYAKTAVYALKNAGAVSGFDGENFAPQENATRAQAAKIIYYVMN